MSEAHPPLLPLVLDRVPLGLRQALNQEGIPWTERRAGRIDGRFVLFDSRSGPSVLLGKGQAAIDVHALRRQFRHDPFEDLLDERASRASWTLDKLTATEEVARIDKRDVRRRFMTALRAMVEAQQGIWLRVGAFPFPYRSAFNLRFDHDTYVPGQFERLLRALSGAEDATTHFVCGAAFEPHSAALTRLRAFDVGSHGYLHHLYQDADDNLRNIRRGTELLARSGIEARGFAAPHGRFNLGLLHALEALGVSHSSEFGLAYDELPFYPGGSHVLQMPVHPVSLGMFAAASAAARTGAPPENASRKLPPSTSADRAGSGSDARASAKVIEQVTGYLRELLRARYQAGEPIFLYGQACGQVGVDIDMARRLVDASQEFAALWHTTLTKFAHWWRAREGVRLRVFEQDGRYRVVVEGRPAAYRIAGEYWRGEHVAVVPLDDPVVTLAPESLAFQGRRTQSLVSPVRVDRAESLRGTTRRASTSDGAELIDADNSSWRRWIGRTLRRKNE